MPSLSFRSIIPGVVSIALGAFAVPGAALGASASVSAEPTSQPSIEAFYAARGSRPLWTVDGAVTAPAQRLIAVLKRAESDGMSEGKAIAERIEQALASAPGAGPQVRASAETLLSSAWVDYVQWLKRPSRAGMAYGEMALAPMTPSAAAILSAAAAAPSLEAHVEQVSNVNPFYARLREGYAALRASGFSQARAELTGAGHALDAEAQIKLNLERARMLALDQTGKSIVVDTASQRLWMLDAGRIEGSMKVIVGKPGEPTPMIASMIRSMIVNPYWNVPVDLVKGRIASNVLKQGTAYLAARKYEVMSDWSEQAVVIDPGTVDWKAVAEGRTDIRVRQRPGPANAMGIAKFPFANPLGVYLHDTPEKALFAKNERLLSSGCVRLEDAAALARWLTGTAPAARSAVPEQAVELATPVPLYITYLTAEWDGQRMAFAADHYRRDEAARTTRFASAAIGAAD